MRIYIIGNDGITLCREAPASVTDDAPSSTKNADKARDPEMRQTKKGNQWVFRDEGAFRGCGCKKETT